MSAHEDTTTAPTEDSSPAFPGAEKLPFTPTEPSRTNIAPAIEPREGMSAKEHHQSRFGEHTAERVTAHKKAIQIAVKVMPFVGLAFSIGLVAWGIKTGTLESLDSLQAYIDSLGIWGPIGFMAASFASVMFPIIPAGLLVIAAPILFGPIEGTIYNWLAVCAGSLTNFIVARQVGMALIEAMFSEKTIEKYLGWTRKSGFTTLFAAAIVLPIAPDDLLCYLAGTTKMKFSTYTWIILLGKIPTLVAYGLGISALVTNLLPW